MSKNVSASKEIFHRNNTLTNISHIGIIYIDQLSDVSTKALLVLSDRNSSAS